MTSRARCTRSGRARQQLTHELLDAPGCADLVAGTQQQPAVRPGGVDLHTATALLLVLDPLADVGEHLVGKHHKVEVV